MKIKLTLQEKLRDLRNERKLTLAELFEATGIPLSTLQRLEGTEDIRVGYQEVAVLARFYDVSADYLFDLTDNRQYRNVEIDTLALSDAAISALKDKKMNNRLISELLSHQDFQQLLGAIEIYIDRKVMPQMSTMNAIYKLTADTIKENFEVSDEDEYLKTLQEAIVDEDEYLRYRISERFNIIMKSLFDTHKKDALPAEQMDVIEEMKEDIEIYFAGKDNPGRAKLTQLAKKINLNITKLSDEEIKVLMKALEKSEVYKNAKNTKKRKK